MDKISRFKGRVVKSIVSTLACTFLLGCIKDDTHLIPQPQGDKVAFQLNIPTNTKLITRATTAASEAELTIKQGYCLIYPNYSASSKPKMTYVFDIEKDISDGGSGTVDPIITIPKKVTIEPTDIVIFIFNTPFSGSNNFGERLDDTQYSQISTNFPLEGSGGFQTITNGIPMYGQLSGYSSGSTQTVNIYRSVAKIQVKLKSPMTGSASNVADFTTENVKYNIFNIAIKGNVNTGAGFDNTTTQALNSNDQNENPQGSIASATIERQTGTSTDGDNYNGSSYIYEYHYSENIIGTGNSSSVAINTPHKDRLAIILHNSNNNKYYRLDLSDIGPEYIDIVRNHHYKIVINEVNSDGYASADEALNGDPSNIIYEIIDDSGTTTISNGKYAISVGEELYANNSLTAQVSTPIIIAKDLRYITPTGLPIPSGLNNSIVCIDATTKTPIASSIVVSSPSTLSDVATPMSLTFIDQNYNGELAFEVTLGDLSYESAPFSIILSSESPDANCQIVPLTGKTITIPVIDRVNTFWSLPENIAASSNIVDASTEWYAEVIWADFDYSVGDKIIIHQNGESASDFGLGVNEGLTISIGALTNPGNVIIGLKKKGATSAATDYLWSWHLWITDYDPDVYTGSKPWSTNEFYNTTGGQVHSYSDASGKTFWSVDYSGSVVMDRNLGATVSIGVDGGVIDNAIAGADAYGLTYQWGRKDPFPYSTGTDNTTTPTWGKITTNMWPNSLAGPLAKIDAVNNPHQFITSTSHDWQDPQDDLSWRDEINEKSLYDPCPSGWKVAPIGVFSNFSTTNSLGNPGNADHGRSYTGGGNLASWYPAGGFRMYTDGSHGYTGSYGVYWSSTHTNEYSYMTYFIEAYLFTDVTVGRGYSFDVRCLKE